MTQVVDQKQLADLTELNMTTNKYFEDLEEMFATQGWKQFIKDTKEVYDSLSYDSCSTLEAFFLTKGRRQQLERVLAFETSIGHAKTMAQDLEIDD